MLKKLFKVAIVSLSAMVTAAASSVAMAQTTSSYIPSGATAAITQTQTDFGTLYAAAFGVLLVTTGSMFAWKWFSKLGKKA